MALTKVKSGGITDATIATADIANGAVSTNKIADNQITSAKIVDTAVTLAKLEHGTSSNDGKFLRANNGADPTFETVSGTTINSNSDNRVITGSGTANTLNAESTFTHDPSTTDTTIQHNTNTVADLIIQNDGSGTAAGARLTLQSGSNANTGPQLDMRVGSDSWTLQTPKNAGNLDFNDNGSLAFKMAGSGNFDVITGDVTINGSGKGIDFAQGANTGTAANILDDYEEGTWTVGVDTGSATSSLGYYVKIGKMVHIRGEITLDHITGTNVVQVSGLPFQPLTSSPGGATFEGSVRGYGAADLSTGRFTTNCTVDSGNRVGFGTMAAQGQGWEMLKHNDFNSTNNAIRFTVTYQVG